MSNLERHVVVDAREERPAQCALQAVSAPPHQPQRAGARHCAAAQRQRTEGQLRQQDTLQQDQQQGRQQGQQQGRQQGQQQGLRPCCSCCCYSSCLY